MRLNFISNLDLDVKTGGWSGINVALHHELSQRFEMNFVGPINPSSDVIAKVVSKAKRLSGAAGSFHFFSERRLKKTANLIEQKIDATADCDFFHGPTPWILYDSPRPYFLYADTCFANYVDVYHERSDFLPEDLKRISIAEARWLARASRVFFGTKWAMEKAIADYGISRSNLMVVGAGGSMKPPSADTYQDGLDLLFVALDFERKGGRICTEAFVKIRKEFPAARLIIVGQEPPAEVLELPGVSYAGFLRKSVPAELSKLEGLYSAAFLLIHPTSSDIQPLVISEAGYFGCPSIASRNFGIPELIEDGVTGFLIDLPLDADSFAARIRQLAADRSTYIEMRKRVRAHALANQTWTAVGSRMADAITLASVPA